jgi:hypothetical protein
MNYILTFLCAVCASLILTSCSTVSDRSIRIEKEDNGSNVIVYASASVNYLISPDGLFKTDHEETLIRVFGTGSNMDDSNDPIRAFLKDRGSTSKYDFGTVFTFGKDFDVNRDAKHRDYYYNAGYLWLSEDRRTLGVALFHIDPPTEIKKSEFNAPYSISEEGAGLLLRK